MKYLICLIIATTIAAPATAHPQDEAINAVYGRLAAARAASDVEAMAAAFGEGGILIDGRPGPATPTAGLAAQLRPMAERIRADNVRVETAYRVERRSVLGEIALDAGYMLQTITRPDGQAATMYSRFLVTLRRERDGSWRIVGDASMRTDEAAWNGLSRQQGLRFDG
jgi:uncharacterized protein (TIGR02246 family)